MRVSSSFAGSLYRGNRVSAPQFLHPYSSTLDALAEASSGVGLPPPFNCMLLPRAPHAEHGGLFVHLKKSFLNQLLEGRTTGHSERPRR